MTTARRLATLVALAIALAVAPAHAQYEEDEQTDDHARRDQRYLERYTEKAEQPTTGDADADYAKAEAEFFEFVDGLIRDRDYSAANSARYRVQTDDPRLDPKATTALLERFRDFFDRFWEPKVEMRPYDRRARFFLFYSFHKYNKLLHADFSRSENRPAGHYGGSFDAVTIHSDANSPGDLADTVVHEAAHQLLDLRFEWKSGQPIWFAEGMASYFGFTLMDRDYGFREGRVGAKGIGLFRDGKVSKSQKARAWLNSFRDGMKDADRGDTIYGNLLATKDPNRFYGGGNPQFNYAASWLLVHYLFHGEDGKHADGFVRYVTAEMRGEGGPDVLLREIGMTPEALDRAVAAHAKKGVK